MFRDHTSGNVTRDLEILPSADNVLFLPVPVALIEQQFERCLDMRTPVAREWVAALFANPPDGLHGDSLRLLAEAHQYKLDTVGQWSDLLPVLIARTMGGNTLTDMLGTYLRALGCDSLIFPSARNDFHASFDKGTMTSASGWNLVDFRGLEAVDRVGIDIGDPIEPLTGQTELHESKEGTSAGSIRLVGNRLTNRITNQALYHQFLRDRATRWLSQHESTAMLVRGFLWYRTRYSAGEPTFFGICDGCETPFTDSSVAVRPECPTCGFDGLEPSGSRPRA